MGEPINPADCGAGFMLCRECVKCLACRLEQAEAELRKSADDFHDVWESRDKVIEERERALQDRNRYWFDLSRIGSLCEQTADEHPLKAVERTVQQFRDVIRERDEARAEAASLKARVRKLEQPGDYLGALKELERHERHHHAYNEVFVRELAKGKSREEAHEIAGKAMYQEGGR